MKSRLTGCLILVAMILPGPIAIAEDLSQSAQHDTPDRAPQTANNFGLSNTGPAQLELPDEEETGEWTVILGVGPGVVPDYRGSDDYEVVAVPVAKIAWRDRIFLTLEGFGIELSGLGANVIQSHGFNVGPILGLDIGRDEDDNSALDGLGDIDPTALAGGFIEYENGPWRGAFIGMAALPGDVEGWGLRIRGSYDYKVRDNLVVTPILGTSYFSSDYNQTYFGISPSQSARSGLPAYSPDGGFWNVGGGINARYLFDENWGLLGAVGYQRITGDAADSPLVDDKGSPNQFVGSLVVFYAF